ncbi:DNRLRE domain-containing protein, partial [Chloroflexi bacterium TSY]|nr:DNRLRE domain-containing protein [Chloroflexi bacterium TSY]
IDLFPYFTYFSPTFIYEPPGFAFSQHIGSDSKIFNPVADTYVVSGDPNQARPDIAGIWVGYDTDALKSRRSLLKFDLSEIPKGSRIDTATLSLFMADTTPNDAPMTVTAYPLKGDFNEAFTWNQHLALGIDTTQSASTQVTTESTWFTWQLKELVQVWLDDSNRTVHFGLRLDGNENPAPHRRGFYSKDCTNCENRFPKLEITYSTPTATPTRTSAPTRMATPTLGVVVKMTHQVATATPDGGTAIYPYPGYAAPGDHITYQIRYMNGSTKLTNVEIRNVVPDYLDIVEIKNQGTEEDRTISWQVGELDPNAEGMVSYRTRRIQPQTGEFLNVPSQAPANQEIPFATNFSAPIGTCFDWDFGDGTTEETQNLSATTHVFEKTGTFTVRVEASKPPDFITVAETQITIQNAINTQSETSSSVADSRQQISVTKPVAPCSDTSVIVNSGAIMEWTNGNKSGESRSGGIVTNPNTRVYMPVFETK